METAAAGEGECLAHDDPAGGAHLGFERRQVLGVDHHQRPAPAGLDRGAKSAAEKLDIPFLGEIPLDTRIRIKADEGAPIAASDPGSASAKIYREIARRLAARISIANFSASKLEVVEETV